MDLIVEKIYEIIEKQGLNPHSFELKVGLANGAVQRWKNKLSAPSRRTLAKISAAFNLPENYFYLSNEWTDEDYKSGVSMTKKVAITPLEENVLVAAKPVIALYGEKGAKLLIDFCELIISK